MTYGLTSVKQWAL